MGLLSEFAVPSSLCFVALLSLWSYLVAVKTNDEKRHDGHTTPQIIADAG